MKTQKQKANSVAPDATARYYGSSYLDLHCLCRYLCLVCQAEGIKKTENHTICRVNPYFNPAHLTLFVPKKKKKKKKYDKSPGRSARITNRSPLQTPRGKRTKTKQAHIAQNVRKALRLAVSSPSEIIWMLKGRKKHKNKITQDNIKKNNISPRKRRTHLK